MKTAMLALLAVISLGCGVDGGTSRPVTGTWTFDLPSLGHSQCVTTLTEFKKGDGNVGVLDGETVIDGIFSCPDGTVGILGGERFGDSIDVAVNVNSDGNYTVLLRTTVSVSDDSMVGTGFAGHRVVVSH